MGAAGRFVARDAAIEQVRHLSSGCKDSSHGWVRHKNLNQSEGSETMIRQKVVRRETL
jgi:hypothetical protein